MGRPHRSALALGIGTMRYRVTILIVLVLVAGIAACLVGKRDGVSVPKRLSISFQGYSNSPSGKIYALFAVTNHDTCDVRLWNGGDVEFSEYMDWFLRDPPGPRPPDVEVFYSLVGSNLCRGQAYRMVTEVPVHKERWRLTWMVMRSSLKNRMLSLTDRVPLLYRFVNGTPDFYYLQTDWIP